jgi:hypothetical protein
MNENNIGIYVSVLQLAILTIGVVTVIIRLGKREAQIDNSMAELLLLKDITRDLVKTDIELGKNMVAVMVELKELRYRIEMLERN